MGLLRFVLVLGVVAGPFWVGSMEADPAKGKSDNVQLIRENLKDFFVGNERNEFSLDPQLGGAFRKKVFWENESYAFGYGVRREDSVVLFGWKKNKSASTLYLREMLELYLDEEFSNVKNEKDLERWKGLRKLLAGLFIDLRTGHRTFMIVPLHKKKTQAFVTFGSADHLEVNETPVVIRFLPKSKDRKVKIKDLTASGEDSDEN